MTEQSFDAGQMQAQGQEALAQAERVHAFIANSVDMFEQTLTIQRPDAAGPEQWILNDAVVRSIRDHEGNETSRASMAMLRQGNATLEIPVSELLGWMDAAATPATPEAQTTPERPALITAVAPEVGETATAAQVTDIMADTIPRSQLREMVEQAERITPDQAYAGAEADPRFLVIMAPYNAKIGEINTAKAAEIDNLRRAWQGKTASELVQGYQGDYYNEEQRVHDKFEALLQEQRDQLQEAVKPHLKTRLEVLKGDTGPAYAQPGEVSLQNGRELRTARGKVVSRKSGNAFFDDSMGPRLGQVTTPFRFKDWSGAAKGNATKHNTKTGKQVSSSQHIVDLAAAMVAGNFGSDAEQPIVYARDNNAEYDLPDHLQGKISLYKIRVGMHRVAAIRLLEGVDALIPGQREG